ncbi:M15 family metallopeptidase [Bacillus sp. T33-2]|uniref:M15 family metallopeptidase n=1 Tax=Bacillus sp. T33-2 TaxID=2054168 RepID=UPI000C794A81|nr:M15 family metallopeptidase [Bacillus sp. T33-2]PLR98927.1 peptidase M15 [Bacillus sp. T33-2]
MKKLMLLIIAALALTGCGKLDAVKDKIPFVGKDNQMQETNENQKADGEIQDEQGLKRSSGSDVAISNEHVEGSQPALESTYFNVIKQTDGKNIIQNPENALSMVNKLFGLPSDYIPPDLVRPAVTFSFGEQKLEKSLLRKEAAQALEKMFADAKSSGIELVAVSGYRSYNRQSVLFDAEVKRKGKEKAVEAVALPGNSEHQTGLAMDISSHSSKMNLTQQFGDTKEGIWLAQNAHRFGFILRYPKGKEQVTGYMYEPWHFRYVGEKAAAEMYKNNWTLEEYFDTVKKI